MSVLNKSENLAGREIKTVFPKVISASRATDIPAFYAKWFMKRLKIGFCEWQNPFNANQKQKVSFENTAAIVFWSKNPKPLLPSLPELSDMGKNFYFQYTINSYSRKLEPGLPDIGKRIEVFKVLAQNYKVIWRYDPVILGESLTIKNHLSQLKYLMEQIGDLTDKLVFSFVDLYAKTEKNLKSLNYGFRASTESEMGLFASELTELRDKISPHLKLATCAEADIDFTGLGIEQNSCIDPELINEICGEEIYPIIKKRRNQGKLLANMGSQNSAEVKYEKDKGQRKACNCALAKDIGSYGRHPCEHRCIYCYAGHGKLKNP